MATVKTRINISVSRQTRDTLKALAKRDQMPVATKTADLVEEALELEEDRMLSAIAEERLKGKVRWIKDSDKVWR
ncbi:MAG TPA: toxin-antitoxin system, antitoxin component [Candidatus Paceibacterota bacterium]